MTDGAAASSAEQTDPEARMMPYREMRKNAKQAEIDEEVDRISSVATAAPCYPFEREPLFWPRCLYIVERANTGSVCDTARLLMRDSGGKRIFWSPFGF